MKISVFIFGMAAALVGLMTLNAQAQPINGTISFSGGVNFNNPNFTSATSASFSSDIVTQDTGTYNTVGITAGTPVTFSSFTYTGALGNSISPGNPMWTLSFGTPTSYTYSFVESTSSIIAISSTSITVTGTGTLETTNPAFTNVSGTFTLQANSATAGGGTSFSFADSNASVPEPATLLLLGLGLAGLGFYRGGDKAAA
jgi:hypothetical protein